MSLRATGVLLVAGLIGTFGQLVWSDAPILDPAIDSAFEWVIVGDPSNPAYDGPPSDSGFPEPAIVGQVNYVYRMSQTEITVGDWLEFANAFGPLGDPHSIGRDEIFLRQVIGGPPGTYQFIPVDVEDAHLLPVSSVRWRNAARYCNWLHNGKEVSLAALEMGAYDTSTFGGEPGIVTDEIAPLPGARYWLPTLDEWLKAVHYDPVHGWKRYPDGGDDPLLPGPALNPISETNTAYVNPEDEYSFRVGRYPETRSPWGLLDASGGVSEWLSTWQRGFEGLWVYKAGSYARGDVLHLDEVTQFSTGMSWIVQTGRTGFRLASVFVHDQEGDLSGDGRVDFVDLNLLLSYWGEEAGDIDGDGVGNFDDLAIILSQWSCSH